MAQAGSFIRGVPGQSISTFVLGSERYGVKHARVKSSEDYRSGSQDTRDPVVTRRGPWTVFGLLDAGMFGVSFGRLVRPHLAAELLLVSEPLSGTVNVCLLSYCD